MQRISTKDDTLINLLSSYIICLVSVQVVMIVLSLFQVRLSPWLARAIICFALVVGLAFYIKGLSKTEHFQYLKGYHRWQLPFFLFLGFSVLIFLILWVAAYIMPDLSFDGNAYHIPQISMWDTKGYIHWINTTYLEPYINGYPKGAEVVTYVLVKAYGNSFINTGNLLFLPLGVLGIAIISYSLGAGRLISLCAGAAFLLIPINIEQSITAYVDTAYAATTTGFIALIIYLSKASYLKWKTVIITGAAMGLTLSIKSSSLALTMIGLGALAIIFLINGNFLTMANSGTHNSRKQVRSIFQILSILIVILLIALICGGYWYIRNYIFTGTPFYRVGLTIFGHTIFPGVSISEAIDEKSVTPMLFREWPTIIRLFYSWAQGFQRWPQELLTYDSRFAGLGFLWLMGCFPAIIAIGLSSIKKKINNHKTFYLLLAIVLISFIVTPLNWWARYTVWIYALGLPCLALAFSVYIFNPNAHKNTRYVSSIWLITCVFFVIFESGYCIVDVVAKALPGSIGDKSTSLLSPSTWSWPRCYLFSDMQGTILEKILTEENVIVAIGPHGDLDKWRYYGFVGQLSQPIGARRWYKIDETKNVVEQVLTNRPKYVIWDNTVPIPTPLLSLIESSTNVSGFIILRFP